MTKLEAISEMSNQEKDIRLTNTLVEAKKVKQGGLITFGVDEKTLMDITQAQMDPDAEQYIVVALVVNNREFLEILNK